MSDTTAGQRIGLVLTKFWPKGQRRAADELSVAQASISRVVNDQQAPSFELLRSLVERTGVDAHWLLTGQGSPFPHEQSASTERGLPLSRDFLPPPCPAHFPGLPRYTFPALEDVWRESRYVVELLASSPAVLASDPELAAGDLLVLETDADCWLADLSRLRPSRLCVVSIAAGTGLRHELGRIVEGVRELPATLIVKVFGRGQVRVLLNDTESQLVNARRLRAIDIDGPSADARPVGALVALVLFVWRVE